MIGKFVCVLLYIQCTLRQCNADEDLPEVCPDIISKARWGARKAAQVEYTIAPVEYAVIHHTVTPECSTELECSIILTDMQNFHMEELGFHDIGLNFFIGGDGKVYEGVGWHKTGAHTRGYNTRSMGIAFIGNFSDKLPNSKQLEAAKNLLQCSVELGELSKQYKLFGARQVSATQSPGLRLYRKIQDWPHFTRSP